MPATIGAVFADISAGSDEAYRTLIARMLQFYAEGLYNAHWGEQLGFRPNNALRISMLCQGHSQEQAEALWAPFWARSEEHTSELPSLMRISYAVFCLQKQNKIYTRLASDPHYTSVY